MIPSGLGLGVRMNCFFPGVSGTVKWPFEASVAVDKLLFSFLPLVICLDERRSGRDAFSESEPEVVRSEERTWA
jgi:hypothetical protein